MKTYYKATRPDGTDFRTGTILYRVGETITHPTLKKVRDDASTYLSVATVPTDCVGMQWPCRLFTVHGVGQPMRHSTIVNKRAFSSVVVVEELPAWQVFGPQGQDITWVIERCRTLTSNERTRLDAACHATRDAAWSAAKSAARNAAKSAARSAAWDAARSAAWDTTWSAAWSAAWDTTLAYLVRDKITVKQFQTLAGPWLSVVGERTA